MEKGKEGQMTKITFNSLFLNAETESLAGKVMFKKLPFLNKIRLNIFKLFSIIFLSFLAIGFGEGATQYLKKKMDNPFVNCLPLLIPYNKPEIQKPLEDTLNNKAIQSHFIFQSPEKYTLFTLRLIDKNNKPTNLDGRIIKAHGELYNYILSEKNLITPKNKLFTEQSWCVIVTEEILKKLSYDNGYVYIEMPHNNGNSYTSVPIPICAVVKDLPDFVDIIVNENFLKQKEAGSPIFYDTSQQTHKNYLKYFINDDSKYNIYLKKLTDISNQLDCAKPDSGISSECYVTGKTIKLLCTYENNPKLLSEIETLINDYKPKRIFEFAQRNDDRIQELQLDYFSIPFSNKDSIRPFERYLKEQFGLKIDMRTIESAENFNFISKFSFLISIALVIFSIISIVLFIVNLILSHIEKIKKNIGTFKAFGLSNQILILSYTKIAFKFIVIATLSSFLLALAIGGFLVKFFLWLKNIKIENEYSYFDLFTLNAVIALLVIILLPTFFIFLTIKMRLRNTTPGNLIYERD